MTLKIEVTIQKCTEPLTPWHSATTVNAAVNIDKSTE